MFLYFGKKGFWGSLVLICLFLNLFAGLWHVPSISSGSFIPQPSSFYIQPPISETILWQKMLNRKWDGCEGTLKMNSTNPSFVEKMNQFANNTETSNGCFMPRATSCHVEKVSVIIISDGKELRPVFLNLLTFLSYSLVGDIVLIANTDEITLSKDPKRYGQRILDWNTKGSVKLIPIKSSLWRAIQQVQPQSEAVVWFNGDSPKKNWRVTGIRESFEIWRENSRALLSSHLQRDRECSIPVLHDFMMSKDYLCYLNHPLIDPFRHLVESESDSSNVQNSIALLWKVLAEDNVMIPPRAESYYIDDQLGLPEDILGYFGCSCTNSTKRPKQLNGRC
jgi:hypothetical protein